MRNLYNVYNANYVYKETNETYVIAFSNNKVKNASHHSPIVHPQQVALYPRAIIPHIYGGHLSHVPFQHIPGSMVARCIETHTLNIFTQKFSFFGALYSVDDLTI